MAPASEECKKFQRLQGGFIKAVAECHRLQGLKRESAIYDQEFTLMLELELAVKWKDFTREALFAHLVCHGCSSVLGIHHATAIPARASG